MRAIVLTAAMLSLASSFVPANSVARAAPQKKEYLSEAEVDELLRQARLLPGIPGLKASAGLEILYATGLRISELLALPASALATDAAVLMVKGKGGRERIVPLSDMAKAAAMRLRDATTKSKSPPRYLFSGRDPRHAMTRQGFALLLKQELDHGGKSKRAAALEAFDRVEHQRSVEGRYQYAGRTRADGWDKAGTNCGDVRHLGHD